MKVFSDGKNYTVYIGRWPNELNQLLHGPLQAPLQHLETEKFLDKTVSLEYCPSKGVCGIEFVEGPKEISLKIGEWAYENLNCYVLQVPCNGTGTITMTKVHLPGLH